MVTWRWLTRVSVEMGDWAVAPAKTGRGASHNPITASNPPQQFNKARGVCFIMLITVGRSLIGSGIVVFEFLISGLGVPPVARF